MHTCGTCKRALPLDQFANRQRKNVLAGRDGTCSSCATGRTQADPSQANAKEVEVAHHFYEESRGQVDGMNRKVKNGYISLMAQRPTSADMEESKRIYSKFSNHCKLDQMNLDTCMEQERLGLLAALATHMQLTMDQQLEATALFRAAALRDELEAVTAEQQRISAMHALTYCEEQALTGNQVTDFISTVRGTPHGSRVPLQVCCYTTHKS